jgi:crotonobetainyl-CoA:carnitine CoA-transferase CaiB-like acyl-CoA transferase
VITVESTGRPDGSRATPTFFEALHGRSESVALALDTDEGRRRLRELLGRVDVVIEGSRPRALAQMGTDAEALLAAGPRIWVSITAHGRDEAHAHMVGYGDDAAAAGGCIGWVGDEPRFVADAVADPLAGLTAALHVAALADSGGRWLVDVALSRLAALVAPRSAADWADPLGDPRPPRPRTEPGAPLPLGRDTDRVLGEFGIA